MRPFASLAAAAALSLAAPGCSEYLVRRDSLDYGAGNAVNTNIVTQVIDPWPRASGSTDPTTSGERSGRAVERYRTGASAATAATPGVGVATTVGITGPAATR